MDYTLNIRGQLMSLETPCVMGIMNVTPDSFYAASRVQNEEDIAQRAQQMAIDGAAIIDVGACSTRPGSEPVTEQEEMERLRMALPVVRRAVPNAAISVDTFRPAVARMAVEELGADIINDVGTPSDLSEAEKPLTEMFRTVARMGVPYVLMSRAADMQTMMIELARNVQQLRDLGQKDIIIDPGFGFGKTLEDNFTVMRELELLQMMELPVLVGVSRKRMVYETLGCRPEQSLNGTTVLNTLALMKGASILRVHDVREAAECVRIFAATMSQHTGQE